MDEIVKDVEEKDLTVSTSRMQPTKLLPAVDENGEITFADQLALCQFQRECICGL